MNNIQGFINIFGNGLAYPVRFDASGSRLVVARGEQSVKDSIRQILATDPDERPYLQRNGVPFGTRIRRLLFSNVEAASAVAPFDIQQALDTWEPRIQDVRVTSTVQNQPEGGAALLVNVSFRYRSSNRVDNLVYPFFVAPI